MFGGGVVSVLSVVVATVGAPAHGEACMQAVKTIPAGAIVAVGDFERAACAKSDPAFRYDARARAIRALRELKRGEVVEAPPASLLPTVRRGEHLVVSATVGPVVVQRDVEALQAASPGERLFVRAADGAVFSVLLPEARP